MEDANDRNKDELPNAAMQQNVHRKEIMDDVVRTKTHSNRREDNNDNEELAGELNFPTEATNTMLLTACASSW